MDIIAFYLPQYHPTPHNDEWWGKGFTEWTNVAKAKPLFPGHYQPKIPADLGFYDLRLPEVREQQAELAKEAGVTGFCYYHYWFGNGHQELERPFNEVVKSRKPDFPFCLCWANESWYQKFWNKDGNVAKKKDLAIQQYLGAEDDEKHFYELLPAFKDSRYIRVEGKLLFVIYRPLAFEDVTGFIKRWNKLAQDNGLEGFFFVGYTLNIKKEYQPIKDLGFDAVCLCRLDRSPNRNFYWLIRKVFSVIFNVPRRISYKRMIKKMTGPEDLYDDIFPTIVPNWDHTPRSGRSGDLFTNSTPELFEKHAKIVMDSVMDKDDSRKVCFLKSWNEWGEGNYMEPDLKYGKGYIKALKRVLESYNKES